MERILSTLTSREGRVEVDFKIFVQKIENISFFPIIDLFFRDWDYEKISKTLWTTSFNSFPSVSGKLIF